MPGPTGCFGTPRGEGGALGLFPVPGSAAEFFTNMHRMLRYAALGPVKSFCHHRWADCRGGWEKNGGAQGART